MNSQSSRHPPSYEQSTGPSLPIMGAPEDIAKASDFAGHDSRIYAALRPSPHSISVYAYAQVKMFAIIPCLWPQMICCGPCLCANAQNISTRMKNMMYIITSDRVIVSVADHSPPCNCCVSSGNDLGEFYFENIIEVIVDNTGRGCNLFKVACVKLKLTTSEVHLLVDNPSEVAALIRDLRKASKEGRNQAVVIQPALQAMPQQPQTKRVFVASEQAPGEYKVFNVQDSSTGWDNFIFDVKKKFGLPLEQLLVLKLAELNAVVGAWEDLGSDDKLIFSTR